MPKRKTAIELLTSAGQSTAAAFVRNYKNGLGTAGGWDKAFRAAFPDLEHLLWPTASRAAPRATARTSADRTTLVHNLRDLLGDAPSVRAALVVLSAKSPAAIGRSVEVGRELVAGRDPGCGLQVEDDGVSRAHFKICASPDGSLQLVDLGSTNGTFLNGIKVNVATLQDGDKIQLGANTVVKFALLDELEHRFQQHVHDAVAGRRRRISDALEHLGTVERALHDRLRAFAAGPGTHWRGVLRSARGGPSPRSLTDAQMRAFLVEGTLPSLKSIAHWLGQTGDAGAGELAPAIRDALGVPARLRPTLFALGQVRNVLAHRQEYEAERAPLEDASEYLHYSVEGGVNVVDLTPEQSEALRAVCDQLVLAR